MRVRWARVPAFNTPTKERPALCALQSGALHLLPFVAAVHRVQHRGV